MHCGYRFVCENAFYDRERKAYVHMREWAPFTGWIITRGCRSAREGALPVPGELLFGAVGVSPVLQTIAKTEGSSASALRPDSIDTFKPPEQRLAVYLAKMFVSQGVHKR